MGCLSGFRRGAELLPTGPVTGPGRQWRLSACAAILARPSGATTASVAGHLRHFQEVGFRMKLRLLAATVAALTLVAGFAAGPGHHDRKGQAQLLLRLSTSAATSLRAASRSTSPLSIKAMQDAYAKKQPRCFGEGARAGDRRPAEAPAGAGRPAQGRVRQGRRRQQGASATSSWPPTRPRLA